MIEPKPMPYHLWGIPIVWNGKLTLWKRFLIKFWIWKMKRKYETIFDYLEQTGQKLGILGL